MVTHPDGHDRFGPLDLFRGVRLIVKSIASPQTHEDYLDGVRGIAVLMVMAHHAINATPEAYRWSYVRSWLDVGHLGVPLFFILSAYTIFRSSLLRFRENRRPVLSFYLRRGFRILPFWWLNVAYCAFTSKASWLAILATASFGFGFSTDIALRIVPGCWSLFVEELFYLFFPWLFVFFKQARMVVAGIAGGLMIAALWPKIMGHFGIPWSHEAVWGSPFMYLQYFFIGILLFHLLSGHSKGLALPRIFDFLALGGIALLPIFGGPEQALVLSLVFVLSADPTSLFGKIALNRTIRTFGLCCYSIYFLHQYAMSWIFPLDQGLYKAFNLANRFGEIHFIAYFPVLATCSLAAGVLSFVAMERPCVRLGRYCISKLGLR